MTTPAVFITTPPPLPPGWTEHLGPNNHPYFYHAATQQSTYVRPIPPVPIAPTARPKDKPLTKTSIPGTDWLLVKTTLGNVFYSHKINKQSVWTIPDDIKDAVAALERLERPDVKSKVDPLEDEAEGEIERIRKEVQQDIGKRKAAEDGQDDEVTNSKKARVEDTEADEEEEESEEEEWQKEAAAQLEAEQEKQRQEEKAKREEEIKKAQEQPLHNMPQKVDLSMEEAKALFKNLLREKDINPLHPWDSSLPLFISDPRYVLLPSVTARRDAFDEYCRDRARELRRATVKGENQALDPKEEYDRLLRQELKSTRTTWNDFRRQWKKDRRFYGWGRDDREREKKFKEYLRELGEQKRVASQKAEEDFFALLRESNKVQFDSPWKDIKKSLASDPRYEAVGSSSLREELFNTFLKARTSEHPLNDLREQVAMEVNSSNAQTPEDADKMRLERKERAVKEREQKIRAERERVEADISRSRAGLNKEEAEGEFRNLLTDAIRDAQATWDSALVQLKTDPRFTQSTLPPVQQKYLFDSHVDQLRAKHFLALHSLFAENAPTYATPFASLPHEILFSSPPVKKIGLDRRSLEQEFNSWQRLRNQEGRQKFDDMLRENSFVEFWGRLGKIGGKGIDGAVDIDDLEGENETGDAEKVDMKALAKNVDVGEIEKVLKNDKRYIVFDHIPEQRIAWIRDYLSGLSAPKLSVHL